MIGDHYGQTAGSATLPVRATDGILGTHMHSIYVCGMGDPSPAGWSRQPSGRDLGIVDAYLQSLDQVHALRPGAPINASVTEVTHRLRAISTTFKRNGLDHTPYLDRLSSFGQLAPDVDVNGVFWS